MSIEIPVSDKARVSLIIAEISYACGHNRSIDITSGVFPDGWYECITCQTPHRADEYKHTKILAKYQYLNRG